MFIADYIGLRPVTPHSAVCLCGGHSPRLNKLQVDILTATSEELGYGRWWPAPGPRISTFG